MPTSPSSYTDGTPGSSTIIVNIGGTNYTADTQSIQRPVSEAEDFTNTGSPQRKRVVALRALGSMVIQAISGSSGRPYMSQTFTLLTDDNFGTETFVVKSVPFEASNDGGQLRKFTIEFDKVTIGITATA